MKTHRDEFIKAYSEKVKALETELIEERSSYDSQIQRMEEQIELMKACDNCQKNTVDNADACPECCRLTFNQGHYDYWQLKQSGDDNESSL